MVVTNLLMLSAVSERPSMLSLMADIMVFRPLMSFTICFNDSLDSANRRWFSVILSDCALISSNEESTVWRIPSTWFNESNILSVRPGISDSLFSASVSCALSSLFSCSNADNCAANWLFSFCRAETLLCSWSRVVRNTNKSTAPEVNVETYHYR